MRSKYTLPIERGRCTAPRESLSFTPGTFELNKDPSLGRMNGKHSTQKKYRPPFHKVHRNTGERLFYTQLAAIQTHMLRKSEDLTHGTYAQYSDDRGDRRTQFVHPTWRSDRMRNRHKCGFTICVEKGYRGNQI
jgi:hypothetical protein